MKNKRGQKRLLKNVLNVFAAHSVEQLVRGGNVDKTTPWTFSAEDGQKLLGPQKDMVTYSKWFLCTDPTKDENDPEHYLYPIGKEGKVYRDALIDARVKAVQNDDEQVWKAAGALLRKIDGTVGMKELPMVMRGWAKFEIKAVKEDTRTLEGIATTPTPDRMQDIVDPMGAQFELPLPFLWQHDSDQPIGEVTEAAPGAEGIPVSVQLASIDEPGKLKDRLDEAWQSIKIKLVKGLSIGFAPIEYSYIKETGGYRFLKWMWLELSAVTIPANADASITSIKSFDRKFSAVPGNKGARPVIKLSSPEGKASKKTGVSQVKISEQIKALLASRQEKQARLIEIQELVAKEGRSKTDEEQEDFDTVADEVEQIDKELKDARRVEKMQLANANVVRTVGDDEEDDEEDVESLPVPKQVARRKSNGQEGHVQTRLLNPKLEKGIMFARYVKCLGASKGDITGAIALAKGNYSDTPQIARVLKAQQTGLPLETILKAAVAGGTTTDATWAGPLLEYNTFVGDFIEYLRPQTILGKFGVGNVPALRRVPFNIHIKGQTSGGSAYWVGQGKPKPLTKFDFQDVYLEWAKVANIVVLTEELLRFSNPSAEALTRDAMAGAIAERLDVDFVDPAKALVAHVSPASITNGVSALVSSGHTAADVRGDIATMMAVFITNNISPTTAVWIMSATTALQLSLLRNAFGQKEFPDITMAGGMLEGVPVITSQYMHQVAGDTAGEMIILANASDIFLSDDGQVTIDASREASLQMLDNPTNSSADGTATSVVSMFQTNSVALRAERFINWQKRRARAVVVLTGANYTGG
jgi:HK97 family phage major capsid protein/HK97 family phage prohead protease